MKKFLIVYNDPLHKEIKSPIGRWGKRIHLVFSLGIIAACSLQSFAQPIAEGKDKFLGGATSSTLSRYFDDYWNQVTPGNDGKWGSVEPGRDYYQWTNLDNIHSFAAKRDFLFKEHTLVWGNQQPGWIAGDDSATQRAEVEEWIRDMCQRYSDLALVDVVNEPLHAPPVYADALGGSGKTGWDWVVTAFEWARQYCPPDAKLLINEYNVLQSNPVTDDYLQIIDTLMVRGLIDGIGIQGHYFEFRSDLDDDYTYIYDINTIKSNLDRLADTGLPVYITEFDIDEPNEAFQLEQYKIYLPIFWNHPGVKGITLWGWLEGDVWNSHPDTYILLADGTERAAITWLRNYMDSPHTPEIISPQAQASVPRNPVLTWHPVQTAISYNVQVALNSIFTSLSIDSTVTDTLFRVVELLDKNKRYWWRVNASNEIVAGEYSPATLFYTTDSITSIGKSVKKPEGFALLPNYPNPFNPETTLSFRLPQAENVRLALLNSLGKRVMDIVTERFEAGTHQVQLNATHLASGVYFCRMEAGNFNAVQKVILIR